MNAEDPIQAQHITVRSLLKDYRRYHSVTLCHLASTLGYTKSHLSRIENGERYPSSDFIDAICKLMTLSPAVKALLYVQMLEGSDKLPSHEPLTPKQRTLLVKVLADLHSLPDSVCDSIIQGYFRG